jgi:ATP phosphoribosyltransferase regulatory subunit
LGRWKKNVPEGIRDILFKDCANKITVEQKLREFYLKRGYLQIITPTIEFYDVFDSESVWMEQEKMYKLFDSNGRILVLRPDITTPIARIAGTKLKDTYYPSKLCYSLNVYRSNENLNGKSNEFTQSGVEIIGSDSLRADIEVMVTAIKALIEVGLVDFKVELGQVQFFKAIMEDTNLEEEDMEKVRSYIEDKNFGALNDFLNSREDLDQGTVILLSTLPRLFGDISVIDKARKMTNNAKALEALNIIEDIYKILCSMGLSQYFSVDLGMVHHINYYTGVIFRGYVEGAGKDVLYGGRYDGLINNFGANLPATGFALDVDSLVDILGKEGRIEGDLTEDYLICYDLSNIEAANNLADNMRSKGFICELSLYEEVSENIRYAKARKIKNIVTLNESGESYIYDVNSETSKAFDWGN